VQIADAVVVGGVEVTVGVAVTHCLTCSSGDTSDWGEGAIPRATSPGTASSAKSEKLNYGVEKK